MRPRTARTGFTLIELLVVIAIISLLVAILMPALKGARLSARLAVSLSNMRQINTAANNYMTDNKGYMPIVIPYSARSMAPATPTQEAPGYCTWTFGGKNNHAWWSGRTHADIEAADRPLNPYLVTVPFEAPDRPTPMPAGDMRRVNDQAPAFRDPSDNVSYQRGWDPSLTPVPIPNATISAYDDVGTSYQLQTHWFDKLLTQANFPAPRWRKTWDFGTKRFAVSDGFSPSRMVWVHDQYADLIVHVANPRFQLKNGYGDINKSIMGFMDGAARYLPVIPGNTPASYSNSDYSMEFEFLKPR
jgi:prepilin-type N-terminal cleavage/methylation domain-containing protein